jgi:hypothetical protein
VVGPGNVGFWWKVSCELNWDTLRFNMGGIEYMDITGDVDWQYQVFAVPAGVQ